MEQPLTHVFDHSQMLRQLPLTHTWSASHRMPHCPQLNASMVVSVQMSWHSFLQAMVQVPTAQNLSGWQAFLHVPQLSGSV